MQAFSVNPEAAASSFEAQRCLSRGFGLSVANARKVDVRLYLEKEIHPPLAQGRSTKIISVIKWIRTSRLSIKSSLSANGGLPIFHSTHNLCAM